VNTEVFAWADPYHATNTWYVCYACGIPSASFRMFCNKEDDEVADWLGNQNVAVADIMRLQALEAPRQDTQAPGQASAPASAPEDGRE
jgi:hypothetical protein